MRTAAKVDANHDQIASVFRAAGFSVQSLATVGKGCPDLMCAINGHTFCVEVKDASQPPSKRRFTPFQRKWHASWKGRAHVVESVEQALLLIQLYRQARVA